MTPEKNFMVSTSPHIWKGKSSRSIMNTVALTLILPAGASIYYFGIRAICIISAAILSSIVTEYAIKKLRGRKFVMDGSALVTGLLLALTLPPTLPIWMVVIGSVFAIAIVKEAFGGLGYNIFNPALGGRAFLSICFAREMSTWSLPTYFSLSTDAITTATPLAMDIADKTAMYKDLLIGNIGGSMGETCAILIIIGGIILISVNIITWHLPICYIGTVALFSFILGEDPVFSVLAGGLMLGAFFMATDYVTSPITNWGKVIFGVGAGIMTVVIRLFGGMPEGVCYSILFMNALTPLIDRYIKPTPYGFQKESAK
ncbi:MAG: RnfABCDGE type electron transport complex subunit D [Dehalococcoidia bacterium]|nr:RnfABCDGE type electron transport complex subunit D [Dehalococcoidia bacterium]